LENGLNLDEQNLKEYYDKIEKELNKLKNEKKDDNNNKFVKNEENKTIKLKNKFHFINNNNIINQFDCDLFYYSDEDDNSKKKNDNNNDIKETEQFKVNKKDNDLIKKKKIEDKTEIKDDKINIIINDENKNKNNLTKTKTKTKNVIKIDKDLLNTIEYGIDENGNPIDIKKYFEEENNDNNNNSKINKINKTKKLVALIIQQEEKGKNYLIDLKGNIIPKLEDGYFNYKDDKIRLLIKDFDVQHPELRVFGARKKDSLLINDEDENIDKDIDKDQDIDKGRDIDRDINKDKDIDIDNNQSIEMKQLYIYNNLKNKFLNRNFSYNCSKRKNITSDNYNYCGQKSLLLNQNLLNMKRNSPIIVKKITENSKKNNKDKQIQFHIWKIKVKPNTDDRKTNNYNRNNRKDIFYRKILPKSYNDSLSINNGRNNINNDTIRRTTNILNKSESGALYTNRNYTVNTIDNFNRLDLNITKRNINNSSNNLKSIISNKLLYNDLKTENNSFTHEIKNITCTTSRINLYKNKKINKRAGSFSCYYNKMFNLKSIINKTTEVHQKNNELLNYIEKRKQNKNDINIHDNENDNNNDKYQDKDDNNNKNTENNIINKKNSNNNVIFNYEIKIVKKIIIRMIIKKIKIKIMNILYQQ
jgi:hypothetical protein